MVFVEGVTLNFDAFGFSGPIARRHAEAMATNEGTEETLKLRVKILEMDFPTRILAVPYRDSRPARSGAGRAVVEFISAGREIAIRAFVYLLEGKGDFILEAPRYPHAREIKRLRLRMGRESLAGVAEHKRRWRLARNAFTILGFRILQ